MFSTWNRLSLFALLSAPPTAVFSYFAMWGLLRHGPGRNDPTWYRLGLLVLVLGGLASLLAAFGVGCRDGLRTRGRWLGLLVVPLGAFALAVLVGDLDKWGWSR